jgi:phosphoribosylformylglycinamidine cyclo-ligase
MPKSMTYADAGVDIEKADNLVKSIKNIAKKTHRPGVRGEIGGFGGLFSLNTSDVERPVLVSSTDGVGTKLKIAFMMDTHDTIGIDLVAMCINDIAVQGAKPLFFLDYLSTGKLKTKTIQAIISGIGKGCQQAKCALIGGETAEMPGFYKKDEYDLAGFAVGMVDDSKIVDGSEIRVGHQIIGIASSGLHSNGYSLVRKICFTHMKLEVDSHIPELGRTLGEELITPTLIYSEMIQHLIRNRSIGGLAHITGGGIVSNTLRIVPQSCNLLLKKDSWEVPPIFDFLKQNGKVSQEEMLKTFNNGIGLVAVVAEKHAQEVYDLINGMGHKAFFLGEIVERKSSAKKRCKWS